MKFEHTTTGFRATADDGRPVCVITAKTEPAPERRADHGVEARPAQPARVKPQRDWTFEFVGRPIALAELTELWDGLDRAEKLPPPK